MFAASDVLMALHLALLFGLLGVTSLLLLVTVVNRLRLRHVAMSWRSSGLFGIPPAPTTFILLLLAGVVVAAVTHRSIDYTLLTGYMAGGMFWFAAAFLARTTLITEHGIILNVNTPDRALSWGQVVDYFEFKSACGRGFVFFYIDDNGKRQRLQVNVPSTFQKRFQSYISAKLDARFDYAVKQAYGKTPTEG